MAINIRGLFRLNIGLANNVLLKSNFVNVGVRCIYSERDLGVTMYENTRFIYRNQFITIQDTFRDKMRELCEKEDGVVYTEDLKAMLHLVQENDEDMELLSKMLAKYVTNKENRQYSTYVFGPVIMRMYYYLNQPNRALAMFEDEKFESDFNYRATLRVLMCLLYKHRMFKEMRDVYDKVRLSKGTEFFRGNNILVYAACLKENTPETLQYALNVWKEHIKLWTPSSKCNSIVAYLAVKHNQCDTALEILSTSEKDKLYIQCVKIFAYIKSQKYVHIIPILKHIADDDITGMGKPKLFCDVIFAIEELCKNESTEEIVELANFVEKLKKRELIDTFNTLEEFLLKPIQINKRKEGFSDRQHFTRSVYPPQQSRFAARNYL